MFTDGKNGLVLLVMVRDIMTIMEAQNVELAREPGGKNISRTKKAGRANMESLLFSLQAQLNVLQGKIEALEDRIESLELRVEELDELEGEAVE